MFAIFKPFVAHARRSLESSLRPVHEISDAGVFACLLAESLSEFEGDYRRLVIYRALPCELSLQFLRHSLGTPISDEEVKALDKYSECITRIVRQGQGAHDRTIFGRTGNNALDAATRDTCLADYFRADEAVDTSELGLHENFDEIGIVLMGETIEQRSSDLKEWVAGFIVVYSEDFKTVRGFRHNVHGHIEHLRVIFDERRKDLDSRGMYFSLVSDMAKADVMSLRDSILNFFTLPYSMSGRASIEGRSKSRTKEDKRTPMSVINSDPPKG